MYSKIKAARPWQLAFSIIILSIISCGDPGSVGADFIDKTELKIDTILVSNISVDSADAFLGSLTNSALGRFDDPLFGEVEAVSFFRPSIVQSSDEPAITSAADITLQLIFNPDVVYGNDNYTTGVYNIYQVSSATPWRGNAFRQSMELEYIEEAGGPFIALIGTFNDSQINDSTGLVEVDLEGAWKTNYINLYNQPDSVRDDRYREENFGLIIIPEEENDKVRFAQFNSSRLRIIQGEDTLSKIMLDWGYDVTRSGEVQQEDRIILPNTFDRYLDIDFTNVIDAIDNTNFLRAELIVTEDTEQLENTLGDNQARADLPSLRLLRGPQSDKAYQFGFSGTYASGVFNDETSEFVFDITSLFNAHLFGSTSVDEIYLIANPNSGVLGYTSIFAPGTTPEVAPKIIIYGLNSEEGNENN